MFPLGTRFLLTGKVARVGIISYERKTPNLRYFYIQMLTEKCSSVRTISILNSPLISDTGLKYLTTFRRLQKIQIEGNDKFGSRLSVG